MEISNIFYVAGATILSLGGGAVIVGALSKWLGELWAERILEREREAVQRERELLVRRRDIYRKLAVSMRVFLASPARATEEMKREFLAAYDEAALWAAEVVMKELGAFLDLLADNFSSPGSVSQRQLQDAYARCISSMRQDSGFPNTSYEHRVISFA